MQQADLERGLEELHPASFAWSLSCCRRDPAEAEDVLQDVYLKVLEGRAQFDGRSSLKTWLFAVIRRTAAARARRRMLRDLLLAKWVHDREPSESQPDAERSEAATILLEALGKLARRQREVLELVFYHDMTIEEAAAALSLSLGSARVHYQRGKKQLLARLDGRLG